MSLHYSDDSKRFRKCEKCSIRRAWGDGRRRRDCSYCDDTGFLGVPDAHPDIKIKWRDVPTGVFKQQRRIYSWSNPDSLYDLWRGSYDTLNEALAAARKAITEANDG